jgi:hypothetical protein
MSGSILLGRSRSVDLPSAPFQTAGHVLDARTGRVVRLTRVVSWSRNFLFVDEAVDLMAGFLRAPHPECFVGSVGLGSSTMHCWDR